MSDDVPIMRVPISLPCQVPVLPGKPVIDAPIEQRTERCAVDGWWMVGRAIICTHHLREMMPDVFEAYMGDLNSRETIPWAEMHRYDQEQAVPEWERKVPRV